MGRRVSWQPASVEDSQVWQYMDCLSFEASRWGGSVTSSPIFLGGHTNITTFFVFHHGTIVRGKVSTSLTPSLWFVLIANCCLGSEWNILGSPQSVVTSSSLWLWSSHWSHRGHTNRHTALLQAYPVDTVQGCEHYICRCESRSRTLRFFPCEMMVWAGITGLSYS